MACSVSAYLPSPKWRNRRLPAGSKMYFAGQYRLVKYRQVEYSLSWTISQRRLFSWAALRTFSMSFSKSNSGVCTPSMVSPALA